MNYENFIAQKDEVCSKCGTSLPRGSHCYTNNEEITCTDCVEQEMYIDAVCSGDEE